jgi:hypothetical protein
VYTGNGHGVETQQGQQHREHSTGAHREHRAQQGTENTAYLIIQLETPLASELAWYVQEVGAQQHTACYVHVVYVHCRVH